MLYYKKIVSRWAIIGLILHILCMPLFTSQRNEIVLLFTSFTLPFSTPLLLDFLIVPLSFFLFYLIVLKRDDKEEYLSQPTFLGNVIENICFTLFFGVLAGIIISTVLYGVFFQYLQFKNTFLLVSIICSLLIAYREEYDTYPPYGIIVCGCIGMMWGIVNGIFSSIIFFGEITLVNYVMRGAVSIIRIVVGAILYIHTLDFYEEE